MTPRSHAPRLRSIAWGVALGLMLGCSPGRDEAGRTSERGNRDAPPAAGLSSRATKDTDAASSQAAVTVGRDLARDERRGGHTLERHVGKTDDELRARLARERVSTASTYDDLAIAQEVVAATLVQSSARIDEWTRRTGGRANLALRYRGARGRPIGRSIRRGDATPRSCYDAVVVLRWDDRARDYYVLTSYPENRP